MPLYAWLTLLLGATGVVSGARTRKLLQDDVLLLSGTCYSYNTSGLVTATPAVDSNAFYFVSSGPPGKMHAVDAATLQGIWEVTCPLLGTHVSDPSPAVVFNSVAFMGCSNGVFYALETELDGHVKWQYPPASDKKTKLGSVRGAPIIANGVVYLVADKTATNAYAFRITSGTLLWKSTQRFAGLAKNAGGLALKDGILYGGTDAGTVFALNATTGATLWTYTAPSGATIRSGGNIVVVAEDLVVFGAGGNLTALRAGQTGGKVAWTASYSPAYIVTGVAYSELMVLPDNGTPTGTLVVSLSAAQYGKQASLMAVGAATGAQLFPGFEGWTRATDCPALPVQATMTPTMVYVPCYDSASQRGGVYAFGQAQSLQDKAWSLAWHTASSGGIVSGLAVDTTGTVAYGTATKQLQSASVYQSYNLDGTPSCLAPSTPQPPKAALCWSQDVAGLACPVPTMVNDTLYWPSDLGYLYAMDATTGQIQWALQEEQPLQPNMAHQPAVPLHVKEKDLLLFSAPDWVLYALKVTKSGATRKWRFPPATATNGSGDSTIGILRGAPRVDLKRNVVYVLTSMLDPGPLYLYALDLDTGAEVWPKPYQGSGTVTMSHAFDGELIYYGDSNGFVVAVNATDGSKIWEYDAKIDADPLKFIVTGGGVFLAENSLFFSSGTRLVAVQAGAKGGKLLWQRKVVDSPMFAYSVTYTPLSSQIIDPLNPDSFTKSGTVFVGSAGAALPATAQGTGGTLRAFEAASGQEVMKTFHTGPSCSDFILAPVIKGDVMYATCANATRTNAATIFAIDLKASLASDPTNVPVKVLWRYITPGGISSRAFVDEYNNVHFSNYYNSVFSIAATRSQCRSSLLAGRTPPSPSSLGKTDRH